MELHGILKELYEQLSAVNDAIDTFERIARRRASRSRASAAQTLAKLEESEEGEADRTLGTKR
jgi:hypothetical protein